MPRLLREQRGGVMLEYAIVLVLLGLCVMFALLAAGMQLLELFRYQQALLLLPSP